MLNPDITIKFCTERVTNENIDSMLGNFDVLLEGGDGPDQRLMVNQFAVDNQCPMVHVSCTICLWVCVHND